MAFHIIVNVVLARGSIQSENFGTISEIFLTPLLKH
jgi:hypothetical protein